MYLYLQTHGHMRTHARTHTHTCTHTQTYNQYSTAKRQQPMQLHDFRNHIQPIGRTPPNTHQILQRFQINAFQHRRTYIGSRHSNLNAMLNISASNLLRTHV